MQYYSQLGSFCRVKKELAHCNFNLCKNLKRGLGEFFYVPIIRIASKVFQLDELILREHRVKRITW